MKRTPTTPNAGVNERRNRAGHERPSGTVGQGISEKVVAESSKSVPPGTISFRQARGLKIILTEREGGNDSARLFMALNMLISEKEFVDYFRQQKQTNTKRLQ